MRRELIHHEDGLVDLLYVDMDKLKGVADTCKSLQNEGHTGSSEFRHLAEFPAEVVEQYCNINGVTFSEWMQNPEHARRMLKSPELSHFRIHPGGV